MVPADSDRIPRAPPYSGAGPDVVSLPVRGCHPLRRGFPNPFRFLTTFLWPVLQPRRVLEHDGLGSSPFARHYWGNRSFFLLLRVLRCFSSPGSPRLYKTVPGLQPGGLPHSDTPGSRPVCGSPGFFAAYRVLHRLPKPRHPPCALTSLSLSESLMIREIVNLLYLNNMLISFLLYTLPRCNLSVLSMIVCFFSEAGCKGTNFF